MKEQYKKESGEVSMKEILLLTEECGRRAEKIVNLLPEKFRSMAVQVDVLMVMAGMKASTESYGSFQDISKEEISQFESAFIQAGLRTELNSLSLTPNGKIFLSETVYNQKTLEKETQQSQLVPPYSPGYSLEEYRKKCQLAGINKVIVEGKINSFPDSAVLDCIKSKEMSREEIKSRKYLVTRGGETYFFFDKPQPDVAEREAKKDAFLKAANQSRELKKAIELAGGKEVIRTWRLRSPEMLGIKEY